MHGSAKNLGMGKLSGHASRQSCRGKAMVMEFGRLQAWCPEVVLSLLM